MQHNTFIIFSITNHLIFMIFNIISTKHKYTQADILNFSCFLAFVAVVSLKKFKKCMLMGKT